MVDTELIFGKTIEEWEASIDAMTQYQMASLWRFAPSGHPLFRNDIPQLFDKFKERFEELGGMIPEISKQLGWDS